ncbi:MAG: HNH endonuclease [Calditrichaeota bacterium]|nr:MAG: HNH endonuclease [Calditrichota bacterium]
MKDDIISYRKMCDIENVQTLQRGMNFRLNPNYSVILMSQRKNAPYTDQIIEDELKIIYEGHDIPKTKDIDNPKKYDQPLKTKTGKLTENGKFVESVNNYKKGKMPERIRVYEKIFPGVWSYRGLFNLIDYQHIISEDRKVFRFELKLTEHEIDETILLKQRSRIIPTEVKMEVWKRDGGKCVICKATDELHFDHDIPYSKGGSSITVENVKILCARHNLSKSDKIE